MSHSPVNTTQAKIQNLVININDAHLSKRHK